MNSPNQTPMHPVFVDSTVLVVDDNEAVRTALSVMLRIQRINVLTAASAADALAVLERHAVDAVIQDMNFNRGETSGNEGIALFHEIHRRYETLPVVLLTAYTHLDTAVALVKAGAADYISKPWDEARLLTTLRNLIELSAARAEAASIRHARLDARAELSERFNLANMVYESEAMHTIVSMATQVAHSDVPVLVTGPSGAGKEVVADIIHANSAVKRGPYLKINLGALPSELIEAELFGTESGAFTGARQRTGLYEAANGGTLFLDEIGNLPAAGQAKLLRVLQTGEFQALGSNAVRRANVRIVAATNRNLREASRHQTFREDLYYRLNVIELEIPALADRPDDILPLARRFLPAHFSLTASAENALRAYSWPGNIRELQNTIRRASLLAKSAEITAAMLTLPAHETSRADDESDSATIKQALQKAQGVVAHAARELGLTRQALYRRMDKLGLKASPAPARSRPER